MLKARDEGLKRKLVGFTLPDRIIARHGYALSYQGTVVGHVTSGTFSPSLKKGIGMGYISAGLATAGTIITVRVREKEIPATIIVMPFLQNHS